MMTFKNRQTGIEYRAEVLPCIRKGWIVQLYHQHCTDHPVWIGAVNAEMAYNKMEAVAVAMERYIKDFQAKLNQA